MWRLTRPTEDALEVFRQCAAGFSSHELKGRLARIEPNIGAAASEFEEANEHASLHNIRTQDAVGGIVTADEMIKMYTQKFAGKCSPARNIYDKLFTAPAQGKCPLCGLGNVSTLDHHLPKAQHPALAVTPANLIPACADCNKVKLNYSPTNSAEHTIHPYFDEFDDGIWLVAHIAPTPPVGLRFEVESPIGWNRLKVARVRSHFELFRLGKRYSANAGHEITNIRGMLVNLQAKAGPDTVRIHLLEQAASRRLVNNNSWQAAMYSALADSIAFCSGDFR